MPPSEARGKIRQPDTFEHRTPARVRIQHRERWIDHDAVCAVGFAKSMALQTLQSALDATTSNVEHRLFVLGDGSVVETRAGLIDDGCRFFRAAQHLQGTCLIDI